MPVCDTEFLFALHPGDSRHTAARDLLERSPPGSLRIPTVVLWEFLSVLQGRGYSPPQIAETLRRIGKILDGHRIPPLPSTLPQLTRGLELLESLRLTFFDALIAAAALEYDRVIVGNDTDFDRVAGLKRIALGRRK